MVLVATTEPSQRCSGTTTYESNAALPDFDPLAAWPDLAELTEPPTSRTPSSDAADGSDGGT